MSETAPASSSRCPSCGYPTDEPFHKADPCPKQAAEPAERCKWCTRELIAPEEHACYRAWEAGQRSGLAANPEPAERDKFIFDGIRGQMRLRDARKQALLDAARDLGWCSPHEPTEKYHPWNAGFGSGVNFAIGFIEARAKEIGPDDRPVGAPSELDIAYNRGLIYAVQVARSARLKEAAPGDLSRVYSLGWDGACNRIADNIEADTKI